VQLVAISGEKPDFWPVSKFNTGRFPFRGILPLKCVERHTHAHVHKVCMYLVGDAKIMKKALGGDANTARWL